MGRKRDKLKKITTSWTGRTLASGKVALSLGKGLAAQAGAPLDGTAIGEQLGDQLDGMKGLAMKVGQMVSYLEGTLPPATQRALRRLLAGEKGIPRRLKDAMGHSLLAGGKRFHIPANVRILGTMRPEGEGEGIDPALRRSIGGVEICADLLRHGLSPPP